MKDRMKLSISTGLYYNKNCEEILDIIQKAGYSNIELFINQAFIDMSNEDIVKTVKKYNLNVLSIHTPLEFLAFAGGQNEEYWLRRCLELAESLGAEIVNSHMVLKSLEFTTLGNKISGHIVENSLDKLHKLNIAKFGEEYHAKNVILTTENLPSYCGQSFLGRYDEFVEFAIHGNIPITFDTTHYASGVEEKCIGKTDYTQRIIDGFEKIADNIKNIHLSNYFQGNEHKLLDNGDIDICRFMSYLKKYLCDKKNKSCIITLEFDFENKGRNDIKDEEEAIKRLIAMRKYMERIIS